YERQSTGQGKELDISMFESALSTLNILATGLLYTGLDPVEGGFNYPAELPNYTVYESKDGRYIAVAALEKPFWEKFCQLIGRPHFAPLRTKAGDDELRHEIAKIFLNKTFDEWMQIFDGSDCCVSPVNSLKEAIDHLPTRERQLVRHTLHPVLGKVPQIATPVYARDTADGAHTPAVNSLKDTADVLAQFGFGTKELDELIAKKAIMADRVQSAK
ncbi:MAG TPA: CoA transferase, partial [Candidatus Obscuribacterales bacterium]